MTDRKLMCVCGHNLHEGERCRTAISVLPMKQCECDWSRPCFSQNAAESLPAEPERKFSHVATCMRCDGRWGFNEIVSRCPKCDSIRQHIEVKPWDEYFSKPVAPLPEKECGNCGHPRHTDNANWQCKECLNENTLGISPIDQVCAAYCPTTDDVYVRSVFPDAWEAPYSHWIWTREPKASDSSTDRPTCLSTGGWRVAAQYIRANPVPPCPGDPKGTGFCEFHECENDCQQVAEAKPSPDLDAAINVLFEAIDAWPNTMYGLQKVILKAHDLLTNAAIKKAETR